VSILGSYLQLLFHNSSTKVVLLFTPPKHFALFGTLLTLNTPKKFTKNLFCVENDAK